MVYTRVFSAPSGPLVHAVYCFGFRLCLPANLFLPSSLSGKARQRTLSSVRQMLSLVIFCCS
jgi:hypothetical protein